MTDRMTGAEREALAKAMMAEIAAVRVRNTPALRGVRRGLSAKLRKAAPEDVKAVDCLANSCLACSLGAMTKRH